MAQPFEFRWNGQYNIWYTDWTFKYVDWAALLDEVRILNNGRSCNYDDEDYHCGGRHIVRRIKFVDEDELWLVRIPVIPIDVLTKWKRVFLEPPGEISAETVPSEWWTPERRRTMESEIATMIYLAQSSEIPVPKIYGYKTFVDGNPVKLPFALMQCIRGHMLYELTGDPDNLTPEQESKMTKSIALIQCQLAAAPINKLGRLVLGPNGTVDIGELPETFGCEGPFESAKDFFRSWDPNLIRDGEGSPEYKQKVKRFSLRMKSAMEKRPPGNVPGYENRFPIIHMDFRPHNILFDDDLNVVGVIDWENSHSAPLEVFAEVTSNIYRCFPSHEKGEGISYIEEISDVEKQMRQECHLSQAFGSVLGGIGHIMFDGRGLDWDDLLDRYEAGA